MAQTPYIEGGPPEDPITPPVCSYQKSEDGTSCDKVITPCQESGEVPPLNGCPSRGVESSRKAEAPKVAKKESAKESKKDEGKEEKKEEKKEEAKALAQGPKIPGGPPEDPITPPVCSYQKSEDGSSCDKVVVPCQEVGEVPPSVKNCPDRSSVSSRRADAPPKPVEAKLRTVEGDVKKEEPVEAKTEEAKALAQ